MKVDFHVLGAPICDSYSTLLLYLYNEKEGDPEVVTVIESCPCMCVTSAETLEVKRYYRENF